MTLLELACLTDAYPGLSVRVEGGDIIAEYAKGGETFRDKRSVDLGSALMSPLNLMQQAVGMAVGHVLADAKGLRSGPAESAFNLEESAFNCGGG